jgi:hypothetical protein
MILDLQNVFNRLDVPMLLFGCFCESRFYDLLETEKR